jgi:hypothetical protein
VPEPDHPFHCSICKRPIPFERAYYACSVSTCNRRRTALYFCSVECFGAHLPEAHHRDAWAEQRQAPSAETWAAERAAEQDDAAPDSDARVTAASLGLSEPRRRVVAPGGQAAAEGEPPREVLVVVSKLKAYIRARSGMNTSDGVVETLSDELRRLCDAAIRNAARAGRKTVMDRDFEPSRES